MQAKPKSFSIYHDNYLNKRQISRQAHVSTQKLSLFLSFGKGKSKSNQQV